MNLIKGDGWRHYAYLAALIFLGLAVFSVLNQGFFSNNPVTAEARSSYIGSLFAALPDWVKSWMSVQHFVFFSCAWFVIWYKQARTYLAMIVLSHALVFIEIGNFPLEYLDLELVSLNHFVWLIALYDLIKSGSSVNHNSAFGLWHKVAIFQISFSLIFDIPDGLHYLWQLIA